MSDNALTIQVKNQHLPNWQTLKLILSSLIVFNFYLNIVPSEKSDYSILINLFDLVFLLRHIQAEEFHGRIGVHI